MSVKANYFKVGVFVIVSVGLAVGAVVSFAMPKLEKPIYIETYMDESVAGLNEGSQILYRGVKIGRVEKIAFASTRYKTIPEYAKYVVLDMVIESEKLFGVNKSLDVMQELDGMIEAGLRIRITSNPLTGLSYLEADYPMGVSESLKFDWQPKYYYIPSDLSVLNKFSQTAQEAFEAMEQMDVVGLMTQLSELITRLDQTVVDANVKGISEKTERLLDTLDEKVSQADIKGLNEKSDELITKLDKAVQDADLEEVSAKVREVLTELSEAARRIKLILGVEGQQPKANVEDVLASMDEVLDKIDSLTVSQRPDIEKIIDDIRHSAENIKELSADLKKNPGMLLAVPDKSEVIK